MRENLSSRFPAVILKPVCSATVTSDNTEILRRARLTAIFIIGIENQYNSNFYLYKDWLLLTLSVK